MLDALILEGKAEVTSKGKYRRATAKTVTGVFTAHPRGFGFVEVEGREEDVFIAEENVGGALHQDTVQVLLLPASTGKRQEGRILRILEHGIHEVIGTYRRAGPMGLFCRTIRGLRPIFLFRRSTAWARCRDTKCLWS